MVFLFLDQFSIKVLMNFLKNKAKDINEAKNINSFDINYNSPNTESFKISQNNNSDHSQRDIPKDSLEFTSNKNSENPGKASSSESNTEKVIPYEQGNIITSNNAYSANETINIKLDKTKKKKR